MANPTLTQASNIADSAQGRAAAFVPTNMRATSAGMPLSVQADIPTFPGTSPAQTVTGSWVLASTRVTASGVGLVNTGAVGVGYNPVPASTGPLQIIPGNSHVIIAP